MNNVLFFSGCDAEYFELCMDLIASLRRARGRISRMRIFDLWLLPHQLAELEKHVEAVIEPDWDLGQSESYPPWFRAMTSRPLSSEVCFRCGNNCLDRLLTHGCNRGVRSMS